MEIIIRASKGKWITDGEHYGKTISLAEGASVDKYHEITEEEYNEILRKQEAENEAM